MEKKKLKMSNHAFRLILIPILVILTAITGIINVAANLMSSTIDTYVGGGQKSSVTPKEAQGMDAD